MREIGLKQYEALKGLAVLAVLTIHVISSLPFQLADHTGLLIINQIARFSVPLFVFLSGYGLANKYAKQKIGLSSYYLQRMMKLLPLYVLWSTIIYLIIRFYEPWSSSAEEYSFIQALILGKADYQLYFVPMILVLYLIFPLFKNLMLKTKPVYVVAIVFGIQILSYYLTGSAGWSDQMQYTLPFTWLGYFVLGIGAALKPLHQNHTLLRNKVMMGSVVLLMACWVVYGSISMTAAGIDSIDATRFTRLSIVAYSISAIIFLTISKEKLTALPHTISASLVLVGKQSYLIFLTHTLLLRIVFDFYYHRGSLIMLAIISAIIITFLIVSQKIQRLRLPVYIPQ